jgi:hypothetical protein
MNETSGGVPSSQAELVPNKKNIDIVKIFDAMSKEISKKESFLKMMNQEVDLIFNKSTMAYTKDSLEKEKMEKMVLDEIIKDNNYNTSVEQEKAVNFLNNFINIREEFALLNIHQALNSQEKGSDEYNRIYKYKNEIYKQTEAAKRVAVKYFGQEGWDEKNDQNSLEKSFDHFSNIALISDGKYRVTTPGLVHLETGYYFGTTYSDFPTWQKAKKYYLEYLENSEELSEKPIFEIQLSENEKIAFSDFDSFNPRLAISDKSYEIPPLTKKYLLDMEKKIKIRPSAKTYHETIKEKDCNEKIYYFISNYLRKDGADILKKLHIKNIEALSPKQAIGLSTQIVIDLTKYDVSKDPRADNLTALELLREGEANKNNPNWKGNGVCRNFACLVKSVFESLKDNQTKFNRLRNTYCLYDCGMQDRYAPKREGGYPLEKNFEGEAGHAWNIFVSISKDGSSNASIVDATWAKRNLETKEIEGLDRTLTRMESFVYKMGEDLVEDDPKKENIMRHVLAFYMTAIKNPGPESRFSTAKEMSAFYSTRAFDLIRKKGVPSNLPKELVEVLGEGFLNIHEKIDPIEMNTIYKVFKDDVQSPLFKTILKNYLEKKTVSDYDRRAFIFKDNDLQKIIFEEIKSHKDFDNLFKKSGEFRARVREVLPKIFTDFSPLTNPEDTAELLYIARNHPDIRIIDRHKINPEKVQEFLNKVKNQLRTINPEEYDKKFMETSDYELVKNFKKISKELSYNNL